MHSLTRMSLNLGFQMFLSVRELPRRAMKKMQQKQQLSRADLQGQALTRWMLLSVSLMHQTLCLGNSDSCRASMVVRERLRNTCRTTLNNHLNTFRMLCRKQLTLSRVAGNRVQSSQPLPYAPSITKVPFSFPIPGNNRTDREENVFTPAQSPSLSPRALPERPAVSHARTDTVQASVTLPSLSGLSRPPLAQGDSSGYCS